MQREEGKLLYQLYDEVLRTLVGMINHPETWVIGGDDKALLEEPEAYNELF